MVLFLPVGFAVKLDSLIFIVQPSSYNGGVLFCSSGGFAAAAQPDNGHSVYSRLSGLSNHITFVSRREIRVSLVEPTIYFVTAPVPFTVSSSRRIVART